MAPMRQARDFTTGVEIQTTTSASANARKASIRSGMRLRVLSSSRGAVFRPNTVALEPQAERQQAPKLAAEVLASGDVPVDQRGYGLGPEETLAPDGLR